jgi:hypothetical protein
VYAASWYDDLPELIPAARRAGTASVCIMADVGFGTEKVDPGDPSRLPDRVCVADPVTKALVVRRGLSQSIVVEAGSPYLDTVLPHAPLPRLDSSPRRIGLLVNPELASGPEPRSTGRVDVEVARAIQRVIATLPDTRLTLRMHPRLKSPIEVPGAALDPIEPRSTMPEFVSGQHRILGTYSTGLLVVRLLGRPALSFQPRSQGTVRRPEVFEAWGIPVLREPADLRAWLLEPIEETAPLPGVLALEGEAIHGSKD